MTVERKRQTLKVVTYSGHKSSTVLLWSLPDVESLEMKLRGRFVS